jgi:hypothetical protein
MPSGTEPPAYEEILPNPRWERLASGFREVGALLVLALPASAPRIEDLAAATDGAILVGEAVPRKLPVSSVVGTVREPRAEAGPLMPLAPRSRRWSGPRKLAAAAGALVTIALAAIALWLAYRPLAGNGGHPRIGPKPDSARSKDVLGLKRDSVATRDSAADTASGPTITVPRVTNPADSAAAAAFAGELVTANTQTGAILILQEDGKNLPAATFSPVLIQGSRWFKVIGGAFPTRAGADSLLAVLRQRKLVDPGSGSVVRLPFAFLIESNVRPEAVAGMIATHADHGLPVYALRQDDGTAWLLAGAFESIDQASLYAESLRASGIPPVLVYRKGRMF